MHWRGSAVTTVSHRAHSKMKELSVKLHGKRRDCLASGFVSKLSGAIYPKIPEIKVKELKAIWDRWTEERQNAFTAKYGNIPLLLPIKVDKQLFKAIILFWDPSYRCFTFNQKDLTPTVEEYTALRKISPLNSDKVFWKKAKKVPFRKKLAQMMNMNASLFVFMTRLKGKNECV